MPSEELQAFNQHARDALKAAFNADYDPIALRAAREAAPVLELQSTLLPVGKGQLEMRPGAACQRLVRVELVAQQRQLLGLGQAQIAFQRPDQPELPHQAHVDECR